MASITVTLRSDTLTEGQVRVIKEKAIKFCAKYLISPEFVYVWGVSAISDLDNKRLAAGFELEFGFPSWWPIVDGYRYMLMGVCWTLFEEIKQNT